MVRLHRGAADVPQFVDALHSLGDDPQVVLQRDHQAGVERSIDTQAQALRLLAALVAATGALILLQLLMRVGALEATDDATLSALGVTSRQRVAHVLLRAAAIGVAAAPIAVVAAITASPIFPTGLARTVEPDEGVAVNATVLAVGALATVLGLVVLAVVPAGLAARRPVRLVGATPPGGAVAVGRTISPRRPMGVGARLALQRGPRPRRDPGRDLVGGGGARYRRDGRCPHVQRKPRQAPVLAAAVRGELGPRRLERRRRLPGRGRAHASRPVERGRARRRHGRRGLAGRGRWPHASSSSGTTLVVGDSVPPVIEGRRPTNLWEVALGSNTMRELDVSVGETVEGAWQLRRGRGAARRRPGRAPRAR